MCRHSTYRIREKIEERRLASKKNGSSEVKIKKKDTFSSRDLTSLYSFMSDEEMGGFDGMSKFVTSSEFEALNVGFALDEGLASPTNELPVYHGERHVMQIVFHITGKDVCNLIIQNFFVNLRCT